MKIVITGSTGLVGEATVRFFQDKGNEVVRLPRPYVDHVEKLHGADVLIHLAGASIAGKRWSEHYKKMILQSRVETTCFLAETIAQMPEPPKAFFCASAVGFYGAQETGKKCTEEATVGEGFLADVCQQWEAATQPAKDAGIRVCTMRIGVVLSKKGGAIHQMWFPFQLGLGGVLGSGKQTFSWISLEEMPSIFDFLIHSNLSGPVNVTAPQPVSNYDFTKAFGRAIKRPTVFPVPAFGARLLFGEMADALLLTGAEVLPKKLLDAGYTFQYPDIDAGFKAALSN